jgi:hypothetical protein
LEYDYTKDVVVLTNTLTIYYLLIDNAGMNLLIKKLKTACRLAPVERRLVFSTFPLMLAVRLALWTLPFRRIQRVVESSINLPPSKRQATAHNIAVAVRLASRYIPQATCLTQALTAQILLNRSGIENEIRIGVAKGQQFEAHAWVECGGHVLIGGTEQSARYAPLFTIYGSRAATRDIPARLHIT